MFIIEARTLMSDIQCTPIQEVNTDQISTPLGGDGRKVVNGESYCDTHLFVCMLLFAYVGWHR